MPARAARLRAGYFRPFTTASMRHQLAHQALELVERHHVGAVGGGAVGVLVGLDEEAGHADRHRRAREHRHEAAVAARGGALSARLLHGVGGIEDHGAADLGHDRQRAHVDHQRVVAERGAPLGDEHVGVAASRDLGDHVLHVPGRQELALLHLHRAAGLGGGDEQVGLAAQEGRDLQHVHHLGHARALLRLVHVGDDGEAERLADLGEHGKRAVEADAALAARGWCGWPCRRSSCRRGPARAGPRSPSARSAISRAWARLSIWQGPANTAMGRSLANVTRPTVTAALGLARSLLMVGL